MYVDLLVKYPLFLSNFIVLDFLERFSKIVKYQLHEYLYGGSRVVPCGWTEVQTKMTKLIAVFRNFSKAPNNYGDCSFNSGNYLFTTDTKSIHVSKFYCPSM